MQIKECLDGLDEEQLVHIVDALLDTAKRSEQMGMELDARKKRITAEKVLEIKRQREEAWMLRILGQGRKETSWMNRPCE
ncbi:hypothetical protein NDK47_17945 [Brevibacillus ruminantium]|uniref:Uncharacterized protein n=1 Tax=Brevibacillus ruminantium TaxID=2950604 RepID=A0ABY4WA29_9BACL|nr:hypothetical protein [Brevibacillus ruminantium]USG64033.1 hypothetical protein NDK47_17945 [Brevibacillus ruminantium]